MATIRTAEELVSMFLDRADEFGCVGLSRKQVSWLCDVWFRDYPDWPYSRHHPLLVKNEDGEYYDLCIFPQGGGFLRPA